MRRLQPKLIYLNHRLPPSLTEEVSWSYPGSVDSLSSSLFDLVSINLTPQAQSAAAGGRSSERIFFFGLPKIDRV
jgi:hypothetical protein